MKSTYLIFEGLVVLKRTRLGRRMSLFQLASAQLSTSIVLPSIILLFTTSTAYSQVGSDRAALGLTTHFSPIQAENNLSFEAVLDGAEVPPTEAANLPPEKSSLPFTEEEFKLSRLPLYEASPNLDSPSAEPAMSPHGTVLLSLTQSPTEPEAESSEVFDLLSPNANPLQIPSRPEEVEVIATQPITLEQAVQLAYRNNPDLQVALLELEQRREVLREARAALYPSLAVSGTLEGVNSADSAVTSIMTPFGNFTVPFGLREELRVALSGQVELVYEFYSSGKRDASIQAAEGQIRLAELEVERRQNELGINTINEYYDLQEAAEAIRISAAFLEEAERNLRDTRLREQVGVGTQFDTLRAEVQVANARQDLVNAQRATAVAQNVLASRLNVASSLAISTVPVELAGSWPLSLEESIISAYQNRAELEQQLIQREITEQLRRLEQSALGPQVDLFANYQLREVLTQGNGFNDSYQFGARVSWILFDGGAARARAGQQALERDITEQNFAEIRNAIRLQVENSYADLQANLANLDTTQLAVEQAQRALTLSIVRFEADVGTQLDILNAQSELTEAEANFVRTIVGYNRSLATLQRAVNGIPYDLKGLEEL